MPNEDVPELHLDESEKLVLSPKLYDKLKLTAILFLPLASTLYFGLGKIWGFPAVEQVIGSIAAITTALGSLVSASAKRYKNSEARFDGTIVPTTDGGGLASASLELKGDPEQVLANQSEITFKVAPPIEI